MKYFELMQKDIDVAPLLQELDAKAHLWLADTGRQDKLKVQRETNNITLRSAVKPKGASGNDVHLSRRTRWAREFPRIYSWTERFAESIGGELARVTIVKLLPNGTVYPHIDHGKYYLIRDRYHLILQSKHGSELIAGDERVVMQAGELWRFDNKQVHEAHNLGGEDRIHVIFDVQPLHLREKAWEYLCAMVSKARELERAG